MATTTVGEELGAVWLAVGTAILLCAGCMFLSLTEWMLAMLSSSSFPVRVCGRPDPENIVRVRQNTCLTRMERESHGYY